MDLFFADHVRTQRLKRLALWLLSLPKIPSGAQFAQQRALRAKGARSEAGCYLSFEWSDLIEIEEPIDMESMRRRVPAQPASNH